MLNKAARKAYVATDKAIDTIVTAHQPFLQSQHEVTSTLISSGINLALIRYKLSRHVYVERGSYLADLIADILRLIRDIVWAILGPIIWSLINIIIYATVSLAFFALLFYILFIL